MGDGTRLALGEGREPCKTSLRKSKASGDQDGGAKKRNSCTATADTSISLGQPGSTEQTRVRGHVDLDQVTTPHDIRVFQKIILDP